MTDQQDLLTFIHRPVSFDYNGKKLYQGICGVCVPSFGLERREATSRKIDGKT
jgi:hypothetical protein